MEMRLSAMSDYIRLMKYSAPREPTATGDFDTDPRNAWTDREWDQFAQQHG